MSDLRSAIAKGRRKKFGPSELEITSLLDVIVILLVFLIQSQDTSGLKPSIPDSVSPPRSQSTAMGHPGVTVMANKDQIWVDDQLIIADAQEMERQSQGSVIDLLQAELIKKRETIQQVEKSSPEAIKFTGKVNLIVDKAVKYSLLKKILNTAGRSQYQTYQFVVLGVN